MRRRRKMRRWLNSTRTRQKMRRRAKLGNETYLEVLRNKQSRKVFFSSFYELYSLHLQKLISTSKWTKELGEAVYMRSRSIARHWAGALHCFSGVSYTLYSIHMAKICRVPLGRGSTLHVRWKINMAKI